MYECPCLKVLHFSQQHFQISFYFVLFSILVVSFSINSIILLYMVQFSFAFFVAYNFIQRNCPFQFLIVMHTDAVFLYADR